MLLRDRRTTLPKRDRLSSDIPLGVPTCRNALPDPQCPRTSRVFSVKRPDHCDQWPSKNPGPNAEHPLERLHTIHIGLFVLPSCIFPKHQLSWSCRRRAPPAVGSLQNYRERIAGPLRALRDSGPSLRGARGFTPSLKSKRAVAAAVSRHRFGDNAGHCLRTRRFRSSPRPPSKWARGR